MASRGRKTKPRKGVALAERGAAAVRRAAALWHAGDASGAERAAREALAHGATDGRAQAVLACVDAHAGRLGAALRHLETARRQGDRRASTLKLHARVLRGLERWEPAERALARLCELTPEDTEAWFDRAGVELELERWDAAVDSLERALALRPGDADAQANLGVALRRAGRPERAVEVLEAGLSEHPGHAALTTNLRNALRATAHAGLAASDADLTRAALERALELGADELVLHTALAATLTAQGELGAACDVHRRILERDPTQGRSWYTLARAGRLEDPAPLERVLERADLDPRTRADVEFALGEVHARAHRYEASHAAYARANELRKPLAPPFDPDAFAAEVDERIGAFPAERLRAFAGSAPGPCVLVVGMPRAGTTLVERVLAAHPEVAGHGERTELAELVAALPGSTPREKAAGFDAPAAAALGGAYLAALGPLEAGTRRCVDKLPLNLLNLGWAASALPGLRVVHCRRDPRDVALSCWTQNFQHDGLAFALDLAHLAAYQATLSRLAEHWRRVLPGQFLDVDYEDVVRDTERETRRLLEFLELPWDPACLQFHTAPGAVFTASVMQVREPVHTRSIGRWRHYAPWTGHA